MATAGQLRQGEDGAAADPGVGRKAWARGAGVLLTRTSVRFVLLLEQRDTSDREVRKGERARGEDRGKRREGSPERMSGEEVLPTLVAGSWWL